MNLKRNCLIWTIIMLSRLFSTAAVGRGIIKHVVMFSFKDGTSKKEIAKIKNGLLDLPKKIPTIRSYELGCDLNLPAGQNHPAGKNRVISWTACFDSIEEYQEYDDHEAHKAFLGGLKEVVLPGSRSAIQYEVKEYNTK
jgi:hypothetical protein